MWAPKLIISNNLLLLDVMWFGATYQTGIIICEDTLTHEYKAYIDGTALDTKRTEEQDIMRILYNGAKYPLESAKLLFPGIDFTTSWVEEHPELFL